MDGFEEPKNIELSRHFNNDHIEGFCITLLCLADSGRTNERTSEQMMREEVEEELKLARQDEYVT